MWISPLESLKLAVGKCDFTCCETNHLGPRGDSKMECSRPSVRFILRMMIHAKANHLFESKSFVHGRLTNALEHWWVRGLNDNEIIQKTSTVGDFERFLKWDRDIDKEFWDREGVSMLFYAVCENNLKVAKGLLDKVNQTCRKNPEERQIRIDSRISKKGFVKVGLMGSLTTLIVAMSTCSTDMVRLLLENGANAYSRDVSGTNPLMWACVSNRVDNVKFWLKEFPDWNLDDKSKFNGSSALMITIYMGTF